MPAFVTHSLMYKGLYKKFIPKSPAAFYWGLQGPDLLFYCKISKGMEWQKRVFGFGCSLHSIEIDKLYKEISRYIYKLSGREKDVVVSYIEGFIAHNSLDYYAHPYIFYREKWCMQNYGYKDSDAAHNKIESDIDAIMWQRLTGKSIKKFKIKSKHVLSKKEKIQIAKLYVYLVKRLFGKRVTVEELLPCFFEMNFLVRILTNGSGIVNAVSNIMERGLEIKERGEISSYARIENPDLRIINLEKQDWHNLNNQNQVKNDSFLEMFHQANITTVYEIKRFLTCLENKVFYCPKKIGSFENGKLDI